MCRIAATTGDIAPTAETSSPAGPEIAVALDVRRDTTVPGSEFTDRFRATLELYEVGENMLRQRLRRERPAASAQDIDGEIAA